MRLVVCTPSTGSVKLHRERMMMHLAAELERRAFEFDPFHDMWDNTMPGAIFHARNCLLFRIAEELDDEDWAWWLDSDIGHDPRMTFDAMGRPEQVIARAYPLNIDGEDGVHYAGWPLKGPNGSLVLSEDRLLIGANGFGFGSVLMRPAVARKLLEAYGTRGMGRDRSIPAFDFGQDQHGHTMPEDTAACSRMREQGISLWIAPHGQVRNKNAVGCFADVLFPKRPS